MSSLHDIRVKCNGNDGSDHHLVVAEINIKLLALKKGRSQRSNYFTYKKKDERVKHQYVIALANRDDALYNRPDNEEEIEPELEHYWRQIKEIYSSTYEEILAKVKRERKEWISEDIWTLVEKRRKLKAKIKGPKTRNQNLATVLLQHVK